MLSCYLGSKSWMPFLHSCDDQWSEERSFLFWHCVPRILFLYAILFSSEHWGKMYSVFFNVMPVPWFISMPSYCTTISYFFLEVMSVSQTSLKTLFTKQMIIYIHLNKCLLAFICAPEMFSIMSFDMPWFCQKAFACDLSQSINFRTNLPVSCYWSIILYLVPSP